MKMPKWEVGAVIKIPFDDEAYTYGRILKHPFIAVYDCKTKDHLEDMDRITACPILFVVAVMDRAIKSGRWPIVGKAHLTKDEIEIPDQFMQDLFNPQECKIIDSSGTSRDATIDECEGLERAAVWEAEHVEGRIQDHYAGRKNIVLESLKLKR
jgi:hypothetical protein